MLSASITITRQTCSFHGKLVFFQSASQWVCRHAWWLREGCQEDAWGRCAVTNEEKGISKSNSERHSWFIQNNRSRNGLFLHFLRVRVNLFGTHIVPTLFSERDYRRHLFSWTFTSFFPWNCDYKSIKDWCPTTTRAITSVDFVGCFGFCLPAT
mgnify:CR=1 FL=1